MNTKTLFNHIRKKESFLCVGLDSDIEKIPGHLKKYSSPVVEFNKQIIEATAACSVAYKINLAFYECRGAAGWRDVETTVAFIRDKYPEMFLIADAKRGDIGNTSAMYAETFFKTMDFDAVTVAPYMGMDSVMPFLNYPGKFTILLALTSNKGSADFQFITSRNNIPLFLEVIEKSKKWGNSENLMYVVGATQSSMLVRIRESVPDHFLLVPGIGSQGGNLEEVAHYGLNKQCGLLVNASRSILFAGNGEDFIMHSQQEAVKLQKEMSAILKKSNLI